MTGTPPAKAFTEHVYATKHGVSLPLRIWRCERSPATEDSNYCDPMDSAFSIAGSHSAGPPSTRSTPWLFWSHGGGFMGGSLVPPPWVLPAFLPWCHVVSYGYRLGPHAGIEDMVSDGYDAFSWCRAHLPAILDDIALDAYAVGGLSAGGTLALLNAAQLRPRPRAVLDAYGTADFSDTCFDPKFTGPGYDPGTVSGRYSEGELERAIADRDLSHALTSLPAPSDPDAETATSALYGRVKEMIAGSIDSKALQADVRTHVAATSRIMRVLTRRERYKDNDTWRVAAAEASPMARVDDDYPDTIILHGVEDKVVPVDQSAKLARKLRGLGVVVKEIYAPDSEHCFDFDISGPASEDWEAYITPMVDFIRDRVDGLAEIIEITEAVEKITFVETSPIEDEDDGKGDGKGDEVKIVVTKVEVANVGHPAHAHVHWVDESTPPVPVII